MRSQILDALASLLEALADEHERDGSATLSLGTEDKVGTRDAREIVAALRQRAVLQHPDFRQRAEALRDNTARLQRSRRMEHVPGADEYLAQLTGLLDDLLGPQPAPGLPLGSPVAPASAGPTTDGPASPDRAAGGPAPAPQPGTGPGGGAGAPGPATGGPATGFRSTWAIGLQVLYPMSGGNPVGLAFSTEQANALFRSYQKMRLVLCVELPHANMVSSVSDAETFFQRTRADSAPTKRLELFRQRSATDSGLDYVATVTVCANADIVQLDGHFYAPTEQDTYVEMRATDFRPGDTEPRIVTQARADG